MRGNKTDYLFASLLFFVATLISACGNSNTDEGPIAKSYLQPDSSQQPKIIPLSADEEQELVNRFKSFKAKDGSTIGEVISTAEKTRGSIFKVESIGSAYNHRSELAGVGVCYWIGTERTEATKFCSIEFSVDGASRRIVGSDGGEDSERLAEGKKSFISWIDEFQSRECNIDPERNGCKGYRKARAPNEVSIYGEYGCDSIQATKKKLEYFKIYLASKNSVFAGDAPARSPEEGKSAFEKMFALYKEHCTQLYGEFKKLKRVKEGGIYIVLIEGADKKQYWWPED